MSRPPFEVADVIRTAGDSFREQYGVSLTWPQRKVLDAIVAFGNLAWPTSAV